MKRTLKILFFAFCFFGPFLASAQQVAYNYFYRQNWQLVNPAAMDRWQYFTNRNNSSLIFTSGLRQQWLGSGLGDQAPRTAYASFELAPAVNQGSNVSNTYRFGAVVMSDRTDALGTFSFAGNFTYYLRLNRKDFLHFGVSGRFVNFGVRGDLIADNPADDVVTQAMAGELDRNYADFSLGAFYRRGRNFYAGVSIPQTFGINQKEGTSVNVERGTPVYVVVGSFIEAGDWDYSQNGSRRMYTFEPTVWFRYASGLGNYNISPDSKMPFAIDTDLRFYYRNIFWLGGGYGTNQMANLEVGYMKTLANDDRIRIGFGYGYPLGRQYLNLGQSVEITLSYGVK